MEQPQLERPKVVVLPDGRVDRFNAARFLGRSPKTLADWQTKGRGPRSRMVGGRRFYDLNELQEFAQGKGA
ncbi:MAG: helix-turn-helix domain-containing protein [Sphingomicrobium sp.]